MENKVKAIQATEGQVNWRAMDSKEKVGQFILVGHKKGKLIQLVTIELFMGKSASSSRVYATARIHADGIYSQGMGQAGGGGYCKVSASSAAALESAGVVLEKDIRGRGEGAVRSALEAIAKRLGYKVFLVIT